MTLVYFIAIYLVYNVIGLLFENYPENYVALLMQLIPLDSEVTLA